MVTVPDRPARLNLRVVRGDRLVVKLQWVADGEPVDLSGFTGRAQVRRAASADTVAAELTVTLSEDGWITVSMDDTRNLIDGVWDLELTDSKGPRTLAAGTVRVTPDVTRSQP